MVRMSVLLSFHSQFRWLCCWGMLLALALAAVGCKAKPTTKTPSGTLRLFLRAAKERDLKTMKSYCEGDRKSVV